MKHLLTILLALTCATLHAQSVIVKGTDAGNIRGTGAGSVAGVVIPVGPRFTIQANTNLVVDNDSGIIWARDANIGGKMDWTNAVSYCDNLTNATYSDSRLPSITELSRDNTYGSSTGLVDDYPSTNNNPALPPGHPFVNIQFLIISDKYWASTVVGDDEAWWVDLGDAAPSYGYKTFEFYVWPCRGP